AVDELANIKGAETEVRIFGTTESITESRMDTQYQIDRMGRLKSVQDPSNDRLEFTYDALGNLLSRRDANGITTNYTYDDLGRLTAINGPSRSHRRTYDNAGRLTNL